MFCRDLTGIAAMRLWQNEPPPGSQLYDFRGGGSGVV